MRRTLLGGLAAAACLVGADAVPAEAASPCRPAGKAMAGVPRSSVLLRRGAVAVYVVRGTSEDRVFACRTRHRGRVLIGFDDSRQADDLYGPNATVDGIAVHGPWVTARLTRGGADAAGCTKYDPTGDCPTTSSTTVVADTTSRRHVELPSPLAPQVAVPDDQTASRSQEDLTASGAGAVVWVERITLAPRTGSGPQIQLTPRVRGCLTEPADAPGELVCEPVVLAEEPVDPGSLAVDGVEVTWSSAGVPRTATLGPPATIAPPVPPAG